MDQEIADRPQAGDRRALDIAQAFPAQRGDYRRTVRLLILLTAAVATTVLLGWVFQVETMKRIVTGLTSMNPVTAICFEICCLVLWLVKDGRPQGVPGLLTRVLPLFVFYVGLAKIIDLSTGTALCPDALLFPSQLDFGQVYPSRMAPNVAVNFMLLAAALLAFDAVKWPSFLHPQWLVTPILFSALAALVGYAYDTTGFYKFKQYIPMAVHTAGCFLLLCPALMLSRPEQGYLKLMPRTSPGLRSYASLLPACVLIPAVLGGLTLLGTDHGWFEGRGTGTSIATVLTILGLAVLAFINSVALNRTESVRRLAENRLQALVSELDERNQALQLEIAERKRMEALAAHQATHDPLTGLPNRLLFVDRLQDAIGKCVRFGNGCALFYIDIDHFKPINDEYGHQAGDELLKHLAQRLKHAMRPVDTIARLGGDEFAAIMDDPTGSEDARAFAERLSSAVGMPYRLTVPGQAPIEVTVGISVGIALFPGHAADLDSLVRIADSAMYKAKRDGKLRGRMSNIGLAAVN